MQATEAEDQLAQELLTLVGTMMKSGSVDTLQVADEFDLTLSQLKAMFVVSGATEPLAMHELAARIGLSVGAAGRAVEGLVRHGLVARTEDAGDRRVKRLALTPAGRQATDRIVASRRDGIARLVARVSDAERERLSRALAPLLQAASEDEACAAAPVSVQPEGAAS